MGEEKQKKRPAPKERLEFFGAEPDRHPNTPLTLAFKSGEDEIRLQGIADAVRLEENFYAVEEEILVDTMGEGAAWRERCLLRAKFLALALCNSKKLERIRISFATF